MQATTDTSLKSGMSAEAPAPSPAAAPAPAAALPRKKKPKKRKEKEVAPAPEGAAPPRKKKKTTTKSNKDASSTKEASNNSTAGGVMELPGLSAAQIAVNEQMRRALEEDQYSALGSIVDTQTDSENEHDSPHFLYRGQPVRLDRAALQQSVRKHNLLERLGAGAKQSMDDHDDDDEQDDEENLAEEATVAAAGGGSNQRRAAAAAGKKKKTARGSAKDDGKDDDRSSALAGITKKDKGSTIINSGADPLGIDGDSVGVGGTPDDLERDDGGSIFGQTSGSSNSIWIACDRCQKWRKLRGVVDEKKLPAKWYCSMNKNDPERARCSAPEEEYETSQTPESAADARTRKHLRVWVRRLQCNEAYEARQPTLTRGKKRATVSSSKDPYEWVHCCNPACGKWRAILRIMDAKTSVMNSTTTGEWYCVMNTWDEKIASCAAPQENLPAVGCPPWVMQDEN